MSTIESRTEKELEADAARRRVASDVRELARSGDLLVDRSTAIVKVAVPVLLGVSVVAGLLLVRRASRSGPGVARGRPSFVGELARRVTLSLVSVAATRWAQTTPLLGPPVEPKRERHFDPGR